MLNFTNYEKYPGDLNFTVKSFSKNLLYESEKIDESRDGAVFLSQSNSGQLGAYVFVNRTSPANVQIMSALAIEATT